MITATAIVLFVGLLALVKSIQSSVNKRKYYRRLAESMWGENQLAAAMWGDR